MPEAHHAGVRLLARGILELVVEGVTIHLLTTCL